MDFVDRGDDRPEPISIARCRELLGDEADTLTDQDVETDPSARRDDGAGRGPDVCGEPSDSWVDHRAFSTHLARARRLGLICR